MIVRQEGKLVLLEGGEVICGPCDSRGELIQRRKDEILKAHHKETRMKKLAAVALCLFLMPWVASAQFGNRNWKKPVANLAALPTCDSGSDGNVRETLDNGHVHACLNGTGWVDQAAGGGGGLSNIVEDTTPQLGGTLDLNGQNIDGADFDWVAGTPAFTLGLTDVTTQLILPASTDAVAPTLQFGGSGYGMYLQGTSLRFAHNGNAGPYLTSNLLSSGVSKGFQIAWVAGSTSTVVYGFHDDSDSGMYLIGSDNPALVAGGQVGIELTEVVTVVTVTIDDMLNLDPQSAPPIATCDSAIDGSFYVDSDLNLPCYCNGTNWVQLDDFSTVCS